MKNKLSIILHFIQKRLSALIPIGMALTVAGIILFQLFAFFEPYLYPLHWLQAKTRVVSTNIIVGAYPRETDLDTLKNKFHITTVISLLNTPGLPQEESLFEVEKKNCQASNLKVLNYPLNSDELDSKKTKWQINNIIKYIDTHKSERFYIHCYLGKHRAVEVENALISSHHLPPR